MVALLKGDAILNTITNQERLQRRKCRRLVFLFYTLLPLMSAKPPAMGEVVNRWRKWCNHLGRPQVEGER